VSGFWSAGSRNPLRKIEGADHIRFSVEIIKNGDHYGWSVNGHSGHCTLVLATSAHGVKMLVAASNL
jgi:hypothetical protein